MIHVGKSGAVLAAAAFSLAIAGSALTPVQAASAKIHCGGVNACKGQSACKTGNSSCKGLNSCKGQGFLVMSKTQCKTAGGKILK